MSSTIVLAALLALSAFACKKNQEETVEPEDDTWMPDESLEPEATPQPVAPEMSEEEKLDKAKGLYAQAEEKAAADDWPGATELYEQAYFLVPGKHGFALKVGNAADKANDCVKAKQYLEHFVTYATEDKYKKDRKAAQKRVGELDC